MEIELADDSENGLANEQMKRKKESRTLRPRMRF
jgi:hypothetical protein